MEPERDASSVEEIWERVRVLREALDRQRFSGASPLVEVSPHQALPEIVARVLVAERARAPLAVLGATFHPQEDVAAHLFQRGLTHLQHWDVLAAQGAVEEAAARTSDPALQQRCQLYRLLIALVRKVVTTDVERELNGKAEQQIVEVLPSLDALSPAERDHYAREVRRLLATRERARSDSQWYAAWCLIRARQALAADQHDAALLWLYRAYRRNRERVEPGPYLQGMLEAAHRRLQGLLDGVAPAEEDQEVRAWDLLAALIAHLDRCLGGDVQRAVAEFNVFPYVEEGER